jgi:hypothetical protein
LLLLCRGQVYVPRLRSQALVLLLRTCPVSRGSSGKPAKVLPLGLYASLLRFDDIQQAARFALRHKVGTSGYRWWGVGHYVKHGPVCIRPGCPALQMGSLGHVAGAVLLRGCRGTNRRQCGGGRQIMVTSVYF